MTRLVTLAGYAVILAAALTTEIQARRRGSGTFRDLLTLVLRSPSGRFVLLAAWLWLGWHLFARVTWD